MINKAMTIIVLICLVLCSGLVARAAEDKTVYIEYMRKEGYNDFSPKIGFDWKINYYWGFAASHQFKSAEDTERTTYVEIRRAFLDQQLTWTLDYENSESYHSIGLRVYTFLPLNDSLSYEGAVSYAAYSAQNDRPDKLDYNQLKLFSGLQYKLNDKMFTLLNCEWRTYEYVVNDASSSNPDYSELQFSTGLVYHFSENFFMQGIYDWTTINYTDPEPDKLDRGFILSAYYSVKSYTYYLIYPFSQNNRTAVIGLSHTF